jgi:hypothetical protein
MWIELDDFRMYRRILTDTEIAFLFDGRMQGIGAAHGMAGVQQ